MVAILFRKLKFITLPLFTAGVAVILVIVVFTIGIYGFGWDNEPARQFTAIIPLPVASVRGQAIYYNDLFVRTDTYERLLMGLSPTADRSAIRQDALNSLVESAVLEDKADDFNVSITSEVIDRYTKHQLEILGIPQESAAQEIRDQLGLSLSEFRKQVVRSDALRQETARAFNDGNKASSEAYSLALAIRRDILGGQDFAEAAELYSDDEPSKFIGGNLGVFTEDELLPWMAGAVANLEAGQISEVVASPQGYSIFRVSRRSLNSEDSWLELDRILLKDQSFGQYLKDQKAQSRVYLFGKL